MKRFPGSKSGLFAEVFGDCWECGRPIRDHIDGCPDVPADVDSADKSGPRRANVRPHGKQEGGS